MTDAADLIAAYLGGYPSALPRAVDVDLAVVRLDAIRKVRAAERACGLTFTTDTDNGRALLAAAHAATPELIDHFERSLRARRAVLDEVARREQT